MLYDIAIPTLWKITLVRGQTHAISMAVPGVPGTQRILPQEAEVAPERREAWRFVEHFAGDLPRTEENPRKTTGKCWFHGILDDFMGLNMVFFHGVGWWFV